MKNLRQLLRRSGWLRSAKRRDLQRQSPGSGKRQLSSEALEKRELLAGDFAWAHNYWHAADVDDNQQITVRDALQVINYISRNGGNQEVTEDTNAGAYYDVNGDNAITVRDALMVINSLSRGEAANELVELELNVRDEADNPVVADAAGDINVGVGDIFNLELSYRDLRSVFDATGAIAVLADFAVTVDDQPSDLLKPVLTETQFLSFDAAIRDSASGTVSFALETDLGTTTTPVTLTGLVGNAASTVSDALIELGYRADQFTVTRQTDAAGLAFAIRYTDTALDGVDLPNLVAIPAFDNTVVATTIDVAPIINEREKEILDNQDPNDDNSLFVLGDINGKALVYNLNFESRSIDDDELYSTLVFGTYEAANGLFNEVGGVAPTVPGGIPNITDDGSFPQPFDVLSIPVRITSPVTDLVVRLNPAEDREAVLLYDRDDAVTADLQLFDEDSVVTINAIGTLSGPTASDGAFPGTVEDAVTAVTVDLATLVTINTGGDATLAIETNGTLGTASIAGGVLSYIPSPDAFGNDVIVYSATNVDGTDRGTISVSVTAVNDPPTAVADSATTDAGVAVTIDVLSNDLKGPANESGQTLSVSSAGNGSGGTTSVGGDGRITYTPNAGFTGPDSFTYVLSDGIDTVQGTVSVTVNATAGPTAADGTLDTTEDNPNVVTIDLSSLVTVTSGGALTFGITTDPTKGTAVLRGTLLDYTPTADEFGADSIVYSVSNLDGNDTGTINVSIAGVNDPVIAAADSATTDEDVAVTVSVLSNDSAGPANENQTLTVTQLSSVTNGSAVINNDGTVTFTPNTNFNGDGSFVYTVSDGESTDQATVAITVTPVNDPPVAVADSATTSEDNAVTIFVLANDTDVDLDTLSVSGASDGANGTTIVNSDGSITYTPAADYFGADSFTYTMTDGTVTETGTVSVTISAVNDAPIAVDDSGTTSEGKAVTITVLTNDSAGPNETEAISVSSAGQGSKGSVVVNSDGTITYTPNANENGSDSFTYSITDGSLVSATATVSINITEVNDPPVAVTDTASVDEDSTVAIDVLTNDTDPENDSLSVSGVTQPANGVVVVNANGSIQYTPTADYNGADSFTYTVTDGNGTSTTSVAVTVNPTNDAPVAGTDTGVTSGDSSVTIPVLNNDSDIDVGDVLSVVGATDGSQGTTQVNSDGTITYTPNAGTSGSDQFTYELSDGTTSVTGTVNITDQLTAPSAGDGSLSTVEDAISAVTIDLSTIVTADAGETVTFTVTVNGALGNATVTGSTLSYTPAADEFGNDTIVYRAANSAGSDTGTVTVSISAVNDPPTANADSASTVKNQAVSIPVLSNDVDGASNEGDTLSVSSLGTASNGTVSLNSDGTVLYTPNSDYVGPDSFTYVLTDGTETSTATVSVTVSDFEASEISGKLFFDLIDNIDEFAASPGTVTPIRSGDYDEGEAGLGGVEVRLVSAASENVTGLPVNRVIVTKVNGDYTFTGVAPGTYRVVYEIPDTIIFGGNADGSANPGTMEVVIGPAGGVTASGTSFSLLGTRGSALGNIDILSSTYIARHGGSGTDDGGAGEGGLVSLDANGNQLFFMSQEGFDTIQFAELTLNEERDAALLSVIKADGSVETARLSEDDFVVNRDGTAVQFFGGYDDFNFVDASSNLVSAEFQNYRNAIDQALADLS